MKETEYMRLTREANPKKKRRTKLEDALYAEFVFHRLPLPIRQFKFDQRRQWAADFAWPKWMLLVEVNGGIFLKGGGGHNRGGALEDEYRRRNAATIAGWRVFTFGPKACYKPKRGAVQWSEALSVMYGILKSLEAKERK